MLNQMQSTLVCWLDTYFMFYT